MRTGRHRFRYKSRLFGPPLIVLEVEERVAFNYDPQHDTEPGGYVTRWRDARPSDLETMQTVKGPDGSRPPRPTR